jgi:hypothetical protein
MRLINSGNLPIKNPDAVWIYADARISSGTTINFSGPSIVVRHVRFSAKFRDIKTHGSKHEVICNCIPQHTPLEASGAAGKRRTVDGDFHHEVLPARRRRSDGILASHPPGRP